MKESLFERKLRRRVCPSHGVERSRNRLDLQELALAPVVVVVVVVVVAPEAPGDERELGVPGERAS